MIRKAFIALTLLYVGLLSGEIPLGTSTVGRTAFDQTCNALLWGNGQLQNAVAYAGFGDSVFVKWLSSLRATPQPAVRKIQVPVPKARVDATAAPTMGASSSVLEPEADGEGLTPMDKEALRKILE